MLPTLSTAGLSNIMIMLLLYLNRYFQLLIRFLNLQLDARVKKIEYIKDLAARIIDGRVNLSILPEMTDEEIVAQLIQVKEVGRWTPEMFFVYFVLEDSVSYPLEIWA